MSKIIKIDSANVDLLEELRGIRERSSKDKKREEEICETLKNIAGNTEASFSFRNAIVGQVVEGKNTRLDSKGLRAAHPDLASQFTITTPFLMVKPS